MHGGRLSALCDQVLGTVMYPVMPPGSWAATTEFKANLLAPVTIGACHATSEIIAISRRLAVVRIEIKNEGRLVAAAQGACTIVAPTRETRSRDIPGASNTGHRPQTATAGKADSPRTALKLTARRSRQFTSFTDAGRGVRGARGLRRSRRERRPPRRNAVIDHVTIQTHRSIGEPFRRTGQSATGFRPGATRDRRCWC